MARSALSIFLPAQRAPLVSLPTRTLAAARSSADVFCAWPYNDCERPSSVAARM